MYRTPHWQITMSADGRRAALTDETGVTQLLDLHKPSLLAEPQYITWPGRKVEDVVFLPNGRLGAITVGRGLTMAVADLDELLEIAKRVAGRNLTADEMAPYLPGGNGNATGQGPEEAMPVPPPKKVEAPPPPSA
jgi:hypothetical protein